MIMEPSRSAYGGAEAAKPKGMRTTFPSSMNRRKSAVVLLCPTMFAMILAV